MARRHRLTVADLKRYTGVIDEQLDLQISDDNLGEIAKEISDFESIAEKLELKAGDIATAKASPYMEYTQRTMIILKKWKSKHGRFATYRWLVNVALKLEQGQLADEICKLCTKVPVPAAQFQTSQHSSMATPEYRTMVGCTSALVNTLAQNIEGIGRAFNDEGLIAPAVFETTQSHIREPKEKAQTLVSALTSKMKITRSATGSFFKVVSLLMHQGPWIRELIDTLRDKYEENGGHTFPTWPDTSSEHNAGNIGLSSEPDFPDTTKTGSQAHGNDSPTKGDLPHLQGEVLNQYCGEMLHVEKKVHKGSDNVQGIPYAFGSIRTSQLWDTGSFRDPLKVHFMNPEVLENENWMCGRNLLTANTVLAWATFWNGPAEHYPKLAGIHANKQEAQIRVYFTSSEHSRSFVGNDALLVKNKSKPTMYLNLFGKPEADQRSLVLHEFGHALGLDHEHQRSDFWKVLERFTIGKKRMQDGDNGCAKAADEHFKNDYQGRVGVQQTDYDPQSIMHYWFDVKWLLPKYQNREYVEYETDGILTDKERAVILGVHDRSYKIGELAIDPSVNDFKVLNDAYKPKGHSNSEQIPHPGTDMQGPPRKPGTSISYTKRFLTAPVYVQGLVVFLIIIFIIMCNYYLFIHVGFY